MKFGERDISFETCFFKVKRASQLDEPMRIEDLQKDILLWKRSSTKASLLSSLRVYINYQGSSCVSELGCR